MVTKRVVLVAFVATVFGIVGVSETTAQSYPSRPITIVVPFAPGGPMDTLGRMLAENMHVSLGQPIIIENVTGANGSIGAGRVARAAGDGYSLILGSLDTHVLNGAVYVLPYDVLKDFEPISLVSSFPWLILSKIALPADDLKGFIAWLKVNPDRASAATAGVGNASHIAGIFFQQITGTRFQFVPYRGAAPAVQDLLAGQINIAIGNPLSNMPLVRAGRLKAYAVTANTRLASAAEIPTVDEAGLPGFYMSTWQGLWAPKGTPQDVIAKLHDAVMATLSDATIRQKLSDQGLQISPREQQTPAALATYQKSEIEKWWPIIKAANIRGE